MEYGFLSIYIGSKPDIEGLETVNYLSFFKVYVHDASRVCLKYFYIDIISNLNAHHLLNNRNQHICIFSLFACTYQQCLASPYSVKNEKYFTISNLFL